MSDLKVGQRVVPLQGQLRSGGEAYAYAIVANVTPLILISEHGDMAWTASYGADTVRVIGEAGAKEMRAVLARMEKSYPTSTTIELRGLAEALLAAAPRLYGKSFGYKLAMRVLQSSLYQTLHADERAECDELIRRGQEPQ